MQDGGILTGDGLLNLPTIVNGDLEPGFGAGRLTIGEDFTLASGATYVWELTDDTVSLPGVNFDQLRVIEGDFSISSGVLLDLKFGPEVDFAATFWDQPHQWTIIDATGASSFASESLALVNGINSAGEFVVNQGGSGVTLGWQPVPEPSSMLAITAAGLLVFNRRRRR